MYNARNIAIDNTRFIYATNFAGDPRKDKFGDMRRKAKVLIPDREQAEDMMNQGFNVSATRPRKDDDPDTFVPEYFAQVILGYRDRMGNPVKYPPRVYLVSGDNDPVLMTEENVASIDDMRIKNVKVILNPREYNNASGNGLSLYVRTMYVEQDLDDDPYAEYYRRRKEERELPFE